MYFVLSRALACGTVDCTFVRTDAWLDFSRDLVSLWPKLGQGQKQMRRLFNYHHCSHSQCLKETGVHVPGQMWQPRSLRNSFDNKKRCATRRHMHTQYSIDPSNSNGEYGQTLAQAPSSCEHPFPFPFFREYFVQSRSADCVNHSLPNVTWRAVISSEIDPLFGHSRANVPSRDRCGNVYVRSAL